MKYNLINFPCTSGNSGGCDLEYECFACYKPQEWKRGFEKELREIVEGWKYPNYPDKGICEIVTEVLEEILGEED